MTGNCTAGLDGIRIDSAEVPPAARPTLDLQHRSATAQRGRGERPHPPSRTAWPLYAGLGVVALGVVAGVVISRRRTA